MTVPVLLAGVMGTAAVIGPEPSFAAARTWLTLLVCFDAVFVTIALWTFAPVMNE
jgi:hypothetical protein